MTNAHGHGTQTNCILHAALCKMLCEACVRSHPSSTCGHMCKLRRVLSYGAQAQVLVSACCARNLGARLVTAHACAARAGAHAGRHLAQKSPEESSSSAATASTPTPASEPASLPAAAPWGSSAATLSRNSSLSRHFLSCSTAASRPTSAVNAPSASSGTFATLRSSTREKAAARRSAHDVPSMRAPIRARISLRCNETVLGPMPASS
mmetsp:Transcript_35043/g.79484  ORF Transcript_35043/g.79484 Transcript_35043/m.79484 type:complete len:208 (+) Transcript_35043:240-863(+)